MRQRRFHTASIAIFVAFALGAGIASAPSVAFAQTTSAPDAGTITTQLQPGWNMVGWVGPETRPVSCSRNSRNSGGSRLGMRRSSATAGRGQTRTKRCRR